MRPRAAAAVQKRPPRSRALAPSSCVVAPPLAQLQAFFTFLGNATLAFAAYRIAASNGWTFQSALPFGDDDASAAADPSPSPAAPKLAGAEATASPPALALLTVAVWTVAASYLIKYGETMLPFTVDDAIAPYAAALLIAAPTALNVWKWQQRSQPGEENFEGII